MNSAAAASRCAGRTIWLGRRAHRRGQRVRQVGAGHQRDGEHHEQHDRLGDGAERLSPAGAELRVRAARVQRRDGDHEAGQRQDEAAAEDVAHVAERQPERGQHRNQQRHRQVAGHGDQRSGQEDPARPVGRERFLAEQLGDVVVRLQHARPGPALQPGLDLADQTGDAGGGTGDRHDLQALNDRDGQYRAHEPVSGILLRAGRTPGLTAGSVPPGSLPGGSGTSSVTDRSSPTPVTANLVVEAISETNPRFRRASSPVLLSSASCPHSAIRPDAAPQGLMNGTASPRRPAEAINTSYCYDYGQWSVVQ